MSNIWSIFKKEFSTYFRRPLAYIFLVVFLAVGGWLFWSRFFLIGQAQMNSFFSILPWLFLVLLPSLSMRLFAQERKEGTLELLLTLPLSRWEVVLGKYLGVLSFFVIVLVLTLPTALTVSYLGEVDGGLIASGYLATFFLGSLFLALGQFISGMTDNQIVAFLLTAAVLFVWFILGQNYVLAPFSGWLAQLIDGLAISSHYQTISRGLLTIKDLAYFASMVFLCLFLNKRYLEIRL